MFVSVAPLQIMSSPSSAAEGGGALHATAIDGRQQSTNVQRRTSNASKMSWRTTAAEEKGWMESNNGVATDK
jgi:hypothetical protein